jgi:hypothetical protein
MEKNFETASSSTISLAVTKSGEGRKDRLSYLVLFAVILVSIFFIQRSFSFM